MIKLFISVLASLMLTACVGPAPSREGMSIVTQEKYFDLKEDYFWRQITAPISSERPEFGLAKGRYVAVKENSEGTYYKGPKNCLVFQTTSGYQVQSGGVWIPKKPDGKYWTYWYMHVDEVKTKTRDEALQVMALGRPVSDATKADPTVVTIYTTAPLNTAQLGVASVAGTAIVNSMLKYEIDRDRGTEGFAWELRDPTLPQMIQAGLK